MAEQRMVKFPGDSVILREGETYTEMYKIISGHAEIYAGYGTERESIIGIVGPQACFGELGVLINRPSIYTVIAYSDILALRITEDDMEEFVLDNHRNIIDIMRNMAETMVTLRTQIDMLLNELSSGKRMDDDEIKEAMRRAKQAMRQYALSGSFISCEEQIGI